MSFIILTRVSWKKSRRLMRAQDKPKKEHVLLLSLLLFFPCFKKNIMILLENGEKVNAAYVISCVYTTMRCNISVLEIYCVEGREGIII